MPEDDTEWFGGEDDNIEATTKEQGLNYYDVEDYDDGGDSFEFGGDDVDLYDDDDNNVRKVMSRRYPTPIFIRL